MRSSEADPLAPCAQHPPAERIPWDWRLLVNGKADELLFKRGTIATAPLPFWKLKAHALTNGAARRAGKNDDFPKRIQEDRLGML